MKSTRIITVTYCLENLRGNGRFIILSFFTGLFFVISTHSYALSSQVNAEIDSLKTAFTQKQLPADKIKTLSALGKAYLNESDLENALKTGYQLLEVISNHGTKSNSAKCFRLIGLVYLQQAWYDKSLNYLMKAQELFGETGDSALQAKALMNVGIVHDCMNNLPMSLSYYNKALDYFKRTGNESGIADCELNIAIILTKQGNFDKACENLLSAAAIYEKTGNNSYLAAAYINLGLTYKKMRDFDLAIAYLNKAFAIWTKEDDQFHICYYNLNMGEIMLAMKKPDEARPYLLKGEALAKTLGSKDLQAKAYEVLSDYNEIKKNFEAAYYYLFKAKQINDSILNAETTEKVNQIQYQYEIAKREVENDNLVKQNLSNELQLSKKNLIVYILTGILVAIALLVILLVNQNRVKRRVNLQLEAKNKLIESQKDELIKLNVSKDKFLSILAHDIRNPLSSIYGISEFLVTDYERLSEDERKVFTQDIHTLSTNLFDIINTLLTWSTSQSGLTTYRPISFNIAQLIEKSIHNLETIAKQKGIKIVNNADTGLIVLADENMIYSVLHNLVNNAIKFSFPGSVIYIETGEAGGIAEIAVIDSGMGLSPENQDKLFQYDQHFLGKGTAGESGTGLGLILCKDFVEKNNGTIRVSSAINKGSTFVFTLPVASA